MSTDTKGKLINLKRKRGRPTNQERETRERLLRNKQARGWQPTDEQRRLVQELIAGAMKQEDIARIINPDGPVSVSTLKRKFKEELKCGKAEITKQIISKCTEMALSGKYPSVTMFWLKVQAGWRDGGSGVPGNQKFGLDTTGTDAVAKRLQETAKFAAETLPRAKTGTGDD